MCTDYNMNNLFKYYKKYRNKIDSDFNQEEINALDKIIKYINYNHIRNSKIEIQRVACEYEVVINNVEVGRVPSKTMEKLSLLYSIKNSNLAEDNVNTTHLKMKDELITLKKELLNAFTCDKPDLEKPLLSQKEIDAVVVLIKAGRINFDNIDRILTQDEISGISQIIKDVKVNKKTL